MTDRILVPPSRPDEEVTLSIFLGGSISGASDWQSEAVRLLRSFGFQGWIFNPRRLEAFTEDYGVWEEQVGWEREHLRKASVILFWLPAGTEGLTSRWEIAEFAAKGKQLVVGIEEGFLRKKYIAYVLRSEYSVTTEVFDFLEETCRAAAERVRKVKTKKVSRKIPRAWRKMPSPSFFLKRW